MTEIILIIVSAMLYAMFGILCVLTAIMADHEDRFMLVLTFLFWPVFLIYIASSKR